ncbi:alpha/beta fold hydrolase [Ktedonospora formicarum]|uniref:Epoxide hydrolase n=1 Tax=Ktedonospora formicarum TaxID=2778364 RepID=A0A8J3I4Z9_9CHLR|nr:alpha/beta hydrolase [Ktedonospora formicarum]GHO50402.1 epoxide hydrolase [Ktedonospora formicarum]
MQQPIINHNNPDHSVSSISQAHMTHSTASLPDGFVHRFTKVNEMTLHAVEGGHGDIIVLLHGWPATWRVWRKVLPNLATQYHVIAIDLPGLGGSDPSPSGYEKASIAREIHAHLSTLGHKHIYLVGHDIGAAVAYAYARQFADEVLKLVVMDDPLPGLKEWERAREQWPRWHFAFHSLSNLPEQLVAGKEFTYLSWFYQNAYQKDAISDEERHVYAASYARPSSLHAGFEYYRAFELDAQYNEQHAAILSMPILAIGGEHSPWKDILSTQLQDYASSLQGAIVPACGHFIPEERPDWVIEHLPRFFSSPLK